MRAGELDQRITIQQEQEVPDDFGGTTSAWVDVKTVWAKVTDAGGNESENFDALNAKESVRFVIRYRSLNEQMRISWFGDFYNIRRIEKLGSRKQYLALIGERGVAQ